MTTIHIQYISERLGKSASVVFFLLSRCLPTFSENLSNCEFDLVFYNLQYALNLLSYYHSTEDIEKCKDKDMIEQMLGEMKGEFPNLTRVFVDERDIFLAHSLKRSTQIQLGPEGKILCLVCQIKST